jgi:tetratricopeptide (TPR) repeat protein
LAVGLPLLVIVGWFLARRVRPSVAAPTWAEIQRAALAQKWDEVEPKLERWVAVHSRHGEGLVVLANLYLRRGRDREAEKLLSAVPPSSNFWVPAQTLLGEQAIRNRQAAMAERIFRQVAVRDPKAIPSLQRLIYLLSLEQRTAEAREVVWQIYRIQADPRILVDLVLELLQDQQDVRGFGSELEEFVKQTPQDPFLRRAWGLALLYQGKAYDALTHLEAASNSLRNDPTGRFAVAECLIALGEPVVGDEVLGPEPEQPADAASWWVYHGRIEEALGRVESAATSFKHASELQPVNRESHFRLGHVLERLGRTSEARDHLATAQQLADRLKSARREHEKVRRGGLPKDSSLYERLGRVCLDAGLIREARAWFEECLAQDPDHAEARAMLDQTSRAPDSEPVSLARPVLRPALVARSAEGTAVGSTGGADRAGPHALAATGTGTRSQEIHFEDISQSAGIQYPYDSGASDRLFLADTMGGGVGLIDFDADGWLDVYFVDGCSIPWDPASAPSPNRLYRNQGIEPSVM